MKFQLTIILSLFCFINGGLFAQIYFNNIYDNFNQCDGISSIELKNSKYLSQGFACGGGIALNLTYYDLNGNVINNKSYNIGNDMISPGSNKCISLNNQQFITAGFINKSMGGRFAYLWRFKDNLDSVSYFEYGFPNNLNTIYQLIKTSDNKLYMVGFVDSASTNADILIIKTDTSGLEIWKKKIGAVGKDEYIQSIDTLDGKLIISGLSRSHVNSSINNGFVMCLDTSANIVWQKTINTNSSGIGTGLKTLQDHKILIYSSVFNYTSGTDKYFRLRCEKIDSSNNSVWLKDFNNPLKNLEPTNLIENKNGNIVIIGNVGGPSFGILSTCDGFLNEIKQNGDSIFFKRFAYQYGEQNYSYSLIQSPDNGYCIAGFFIPVTHIGTQDKWLIKLDSSFCESITGCGYPTNYKDEFNIGETEIQIYPNPTNDNLFFEFNSYLSEKATIIIDLYNINGFLVKQKQFENKTQLLKMEIDQLTEGVYHCHIRVGDKLLKHKRVVLIK